MLIAEEENSNQSKGKRANFFPCELEWRAVELPVPEFSEAWAVFVDKEKGGPTN